MGGGRTVDTSATIAPELRGLFGTGAQRVTNLQTAAPLQPYTNAAPKQTAGLSPFQRYAGGLISGITKPQPTSALALRDILRVPGLAGRTPTTGTYKGAQPDIYNYLAALNPQGGDYVSEPNNAPPHQGPPDRPNPTCPSGYVWNEDAQGCIPEGSRYAGPGGGVGGGAGSGGGGGGGGGGPTPIGGPNPDPFTPTPISGGARAGGDTGANDPVALALRSVGLTSGGARGTTTVGPRQPIGPQPAPPGGGPTDDSLRALDAMAYQQPEGGYSVEGSPGVTAAYRVPTGADLQSDPGLQATLQAFTKLQQPTIENSAALSGLGRSTALTNALGMSLSQQLAPAIEAAFGRQERGIERGSTATEAELQRRERGMVREAEATQNQIPNLLALSNEGTTNRLSQIGAANQYGATERGVTEEANANANQDFLRRQALSEQALFQPFGLTMPAAFGSMVNSSGGLFK